MLKWIVIGIGDITIRRVIPAIQAEDALFLQTSRRTEQPEHDASKEPRTK